MNIHTDFTANDKDVQKALYRMEQQITKLTQKNKELEKQTGKASNRGEKGVDRWAKKVAGLAVAYLSVTRGVQMLTAALEDKFRVEQKMKDEVVTLAGSQASAVMMLGDVTATQTRQFVAEVDKMAKDIRPVGGKQALYQTLTQTLSAAGEKKLGMEAAKIGTQIGRASPEEAAAISAGLLDVRQATGVKNLEANLGFLIAMTGQARVTSLEGMSRYGAPAVQSIMGTGGTPREAASLFNALTKGMVDPEGRRARTASITLSEHLAAFLPEKDRYKWLTDEEGRVTGKEIVKRGTGLASPMERVEYLRAHPELARQFDVEVIQSMEKQARGATRDLLGFSPVARDYTGFSGTTWQAFQQSMAAMPTVAEAGPYAARKLEALGAPGAAKVAETERGVTGGIEALRATPAAIEKAKEGVYSAVSLMDTMEASGAGWWNRHRAAIGYRGRRWAGETAPEAWGGQLGGYLEKQEQYGYFDEEAIPVLREMREEARRQTKLMERGGTENSFNWAIAMFARIPQVHGE